MKHHTWGILTLKCKECNVTMPMGFNTGCPGVFSCCGDKSGGAKWDTNQKRWICRDCGSPKADLPGLTSGNITIEGPFEYSPSPPGVQKKCTCGSAAVGSDRHSSWCDLA